MKSILLTTTALVAFAGAAAADGHTSIDHNLSANMGYNSNAAGDDVGFYWDADLETTASATLDNGLTAGAYFEIEVADADDTANNDNGKNPLASSDFVLSLEAENAGLFLGDTNTAADKHWASAGDMESDGFTSDHDNAAIRGDVSLGGVDASVSYLINDATGTSEDAVEQLSFGAAAEFGAISVAVGYQEEVEGSGGNSFDDDGDFNSDEIFGISAAGTFGGATVTVAYAEATDTVADALDGGTDGEYETTSTGVKVAYPFGPVTATAYYVAEEGGADEDPNFGVEVAYSDGPIGATLDYQDDQGTTKVALDGTYDVGNGLTVLAGYYSQDNEDGTDYADEYYVAGEYDLGGGASVLVAYAEGEDNGDDEIGDPEYQEGATVQLNFEF